MTNGESTGAMKLERSRKFVEVRKSALFVWAIITLSLTLISGLDGFIKLAGVAKAINENWTAIVRWLAQYMRQVLPFSMSDAVVASSFAWTGSISFYLSCRTGWAFTKFARRMDGRTFRLKSYLRRPWVFFRTMMPWVPGFIILFGTYMIALNSFGMEPGELDTISQWEWEFTNLFLIASAVLMLCIEIDWKKMFWRALSIVIAVSVVTMSGHIQQTLWRVDEIVEEHAQRPEEGA